MANIYKIKPEGTLTIENVNLVKKDYKEQVELAKEPEIIIDMKAVNFVDSMGLSLLISLYKLAKQNKKKFSIINCNKELLNMLELLRLDKKFLIL